TPPRRAPACTDSAAAANFADPAAHPPFLGLTLAPNQSSVRLRACTVGESRQSRISRCWFPRKSPELRIRAGTPVAIQAICLRVFRGHAAVQRQLLGTPEIADCTLPANPAQCFRFSVLWRWVCSSARATWNVWCRRGIACHANGLPESACGLGPCHARSAHDPRR